jgi:glutathione-regulated potassium-efflux system ancillary protein KefG
VVVSTGGGEDAYHREGFNRFTMRDLLAPLEQMAFLCGMEFLPPFVVHGTHLLGEEAILGHSQDYKRSLLALRDGRVDLDAARQQPRLNADLDSVIMG